MDKETEIRIKKSVREHYAAALEEKSKPASGGCCCSSNTEPCCDEPARLYEDENITELPDDVTGTSFGCGDPVTLASLQPGQTVVDLGSGGGLDCFLAAKRVGATGRVIGVDMTPQMIERARANAIKLGMEHVEFRLGEIEHLPVADASADVVISNCVINLSPDKPQVFREIFRVLKPGGRLAVSDIVTDGDLPDAIRKDLSAWAGCIAGAWTAKDYMEAIRAAGFTEVSLTPVYFDDGMIREAASQVGHLEGVDMKRLRTAIFSAKVRAVKL